MDNQLLADVVCGRAKVEQQHHQQYLDRILETIATVFIVKGWGPREPHHDPVKWRRRVHNKEADYLCNAAMNMKEDIYYRHDSLSSGEYPKNLMAWSDGGIRVAEGCSAAAWIIKAWRPDDGWIILAAQAHFYSEVLPSSLDAECRALESLWTAIDYLITSP